MRTNLIGPAKPAESWTSGCREQSKLFSPWLEVVTNSDARFLPVIRRLLFDEAEFVQRGEPIAELEQNEYFTSSLGHLRAPESGIIRKFHLEQNQHYPVIKKHDYIGDRQITPRYGETLLTLELEHPHNLSDREVGERMVVELIANGVRARKRNMLSAIGASLFAIIAAFVIVALLIWKLATGWWLLVLIPLVLLVIGVAVVWVGYSVKKYSKNKSFNPARAFGL